MVFNITSTVPEIVSKKNLDPEIDAFLKKEKLTLGGKEPFLDERRHHTEVLANVPLSSEQKSVKLIPHIVPGPVGDINVRQYIPSGYGGTALPVLVYIHGGGWTVGSLPEFDGWFRLAAYYGKIQVISLEYRLAPEWRYPVQLNEIKATLEWVYANASTLGVIPSKIALGGDSCGGNMTAVTAQRTLKDPDFKVPIALQCLFYAECKIPFEVPSGSENFNAPYIPTQGVFLFAWHVVPAGKNHVDWDITPLNGENLSKLPPAFFVTCGYDPLRDTGLYYAQKLQKEGVPVEYLHNEDLTHGFLQFTPWSKRALETTIQVAEHIGKKLREE
ncbi:hypothetical protein CAAN1_12S04940 [[Candida] anglica]|uniref:Alpha/beta hydrolase fold-3 domain-containing protein n=1 Tax=[Candida] anglica TaxID=148631 RepID=A0ABP0E6P7_9ASCO